MVGRSHMPDFSAGQTGAFREDMRPPAIAAAGRITLRRVAIVVVHQTDLPS